MGAGHWNSTLDLKRRSVTDHSTPRLDGNHEDGRRGELGEKRLKLLDLFTV
jgi:hypothetical protein